MKQLRSTYFLSCLVIYTFIQIARKAEWLNSGFLNDHLTDLMCMPIILTILLTIVRYIKRNQVLVLPWYGVLIVTIYWSVYFEWYLPTNSNSHTADMMDVVMYAIGSASFFIWQLASIKKPLRQEYYQ